MNDNSVQCRWKIQVRVPADCSARNKPYWTTVEDCRFTDEQTARREFARMQQTARNTMSAWPIRLVKIEQTVVEA